MPSAGRPTRRQRRKRKKILASRRNCSKRFLGRKVRRLYFVVEILFICMERREPKIPGNSSFVELTANFFGPLNAASFTRSIRLSPRKHTNGSCVNYWTKRRSSSSQGVSMKSSFPSCRLDRCEGPTGHFVPRPAEPSSGHSVEKATITNRSLFRSCQI